MEKSHPDATYTYPVLAMAEFINPINQSKAPEPRLAEYVRHANGQEYWIVYGMTGTLRVVAWSYITPLKPERYEKT